MQMQINDLYTRSISQSYKTVMIVDNEPSIVEMLEFLLEDDYEVSSCIESSEVVTRALQNQPDVIVMDLMMPKPDGIEILQEMRRHSSLQNVPVILMTAGINYCRLSEAELKELKGWMVSKPFDNMHLLGLIEKLVQL